MTNAYGIYFHKSFSVNLIGNHKIPVNEAIVGFEIILCLVQKQV